MGLAGVKVTSSRVKTLQEQLQYYQELWRDAEARAVNAQELLQANLHLLEEVERLKKENQELVARLRKEHTDGHNNA